MPVLALGVLVVLAVILRHKTVTIAPDGLKHSRPRIANADITRLAGTALHFLAFFIEDHRVDAWHGGPGAARLHGIDGRLGAAEKATGLRLPPGINDDRFTLSHYLVVPLPDLGLDRLTDRGHVLEVVVVF